MRHRVVLDTNVLVAALRSRRGASFRLLELLPEGAYEIALSVPLVLEYESILTRVAQEGSLQVEDIEAVLDYLCHVGHPQGIFYLWRPLLSDPKDDMVLELAVAAGCDSIVTHNAKDFAGSESFGVGVATPREFLASLETSS